MIDVILTFALMATAITANKVLLNVISPELLVAIRMLLASGILYLFTLTEKDKSQVLTYKKIKSTAPLMIFVSICSTFLPSILKAYSLKYMPSYKAAFFGSLNPFVTAIYAYFIFKERLSLKKALGLIIAFSGSLVLIIGSSTITSYLCTLNFASGLKLMSIISTTCKRALADSSGISGVIFYPEISAIVAIIISRLGWILSQRILKKDIYSPIQVSIQIMLIGGLLSLLSYIIKVVKFHEYFINIDKIASLKLYNISFFKIIGVWGTFIFFLLYTIIAGNVLAYNLYAKSLKKYSATYVSLLGFSVPIFVAFYGYLFLGEHLTLDFLISIIITFIGFIIFSRSK